MKNTKNIKSNTKRIIAIALVLVLVVSAFTACGNNADADKSTTTNSSTADAGTTDVGNENDVPSIEDDAETTTANAENKTEVDNSSADKTNSHSSGKPESKPVTTTRPSGKPASKPVETTTKPAQKPAPTTQPSTPTGNTYAYFRASTGEKIKYCTAYTDEILGRDVCTGISESNGKITATYKKGADSEWFKCDNCGKYLCEGCQPVWSEVCKYCGKTKCTRYTNDCNCFMCGQFVKGGTCHDCPNKDEWM